MSPQRDQLDAILDSLLATAMAAMVFVIGLLATQWLFDFGPKALLGQTALQGIAILAVVGAPAHKKDSAKF